MRPSHPRTLRLVLGLVLAVMLSAAFWLEGRAAREDAQLGLIVREATRPEMSASERAIALTRAVHERLGTANASRGDRLPDYSGPFGGTLERALIEGGECGTYSMVLARVLQLAGLESAVAQMQVDGVWGDHIVTLLRFDGRSTPLDALFDVHFVDAGGELVEVEAIGDDWSSFASQLPSHYPTRFDYDALRLTNWNKVPVLFPALRTLAAALVGEETIAGFSLRAHVLNQYRVWARLLEASAGGVALLLALGAARSRTS